VRPPIAVIACLALTACYSFETRNWGEWADPGLDSGSLSSTATFDWSKWPGVIVRVDQHVEVATGYKSARLKPGDHVVEYSAQPHDFGRVAGKMQFSLLARHTYTFQMDTCYWCSPQKVAVWVDDATTGALVWGSRPDWPRWYLYQHPPTGSTA